MDAVLTPYHCPECGGSITLDPHAETEVPVFRAKRGVVEHVRRPAVVAFCNGCEFAIEVVAEKRRAR